MTLRYELLANFDENVCLYRVKGRERERIVFPQTAGLLQLVGNPLSLGDGGIVQGDFYLSFTDIFPKTFQRDNYELTLAGSSVISRTSQGEKIFARDGHHRGFVFNAYGDVINFFFRIPRLRQYSLPDTEKLREVLISRGILSDETTLV